MESKLNYKFILIILGATCLAGAIIYLNSCQFGRDLEEITSSQPTFSRPVSSQQLASLLLDYGNGQKRKFMGEVVKGMTILDVLMASGQAGKFEVKSNGQIELIDGVISTKKLEWTCYPNNELVEPPLNQYIIESQDEIECRYE